MLKSADFRTFWKSKSNHVESRRCFTLVQFPCLDSSQRIVLSAKAFKFIMITIMYIFTRLSDTLLIMILASPPVISDIHQNLKVNLWTQLWIQQVETVIDIAQQWTHIGQTFDPKVRVRRFGFPITSMYDIWLHHAIFQPKSIIVILHTTTLYHRYKYNILFHTPIKLDHILPDA